MIRREIRDGGEGVERGCRERIEIERKVTLASACYSYVPPEFPTRFCSKALQ